MCLILIAIDRVPGQRIAVLGNRDEFHERASTTAQPWSEDPRVAGGRDLVAGGSWLAARDDGRFAVVTNLRTGLPASAPRSRGWLVRDFVLGDVAPADCLDALVEESDEYGPFNLVVGATGVVHAYDGSTRRRRQLDAGLHAISNGPIGVHWPKTSRVLALADEAIALHGDDPESLLAVLHDSAQPADGDLPDTGVGLELERRLAPVFIRGPRYGTRASSLLRIGDGGFVAFDEQCFGPDGRDDGRRHWTSSGSGWHEEPVP